MGDPKETFRKILEEGVREIAPSEPVPEILVERPKNPEHGDLSSNVAMQLSKKLRRNPREIAQQLVDVSKAPLIDSGLTDQAASIAGAGFLNIRVNPSFKLQAIRRALAEGRNFGRASETKGQKIQVEFVSANPTGPLHVGHGRQGALGDAIAALLESQGHAVTREFYYNDAGAQIENLALSVQARARGMKPGDAGWPKDGYAGEYIEDIASQIADSNNLEAIRSYAVAYLRKEQDEDLKAFGVKFDVYYLESSLYSEGKVDEVIALWKKSGKVFEKDGALWLRTTDYGDDKDRVARKSDGSFTYFVPDVAYHLTKWKRGFRKVIDVQGTDHHSTTVRVRAGLQALGLAIPEGYPDYVLHSLVKVMRGGEEVKI